MVVTGCTTALVPGQLASPDKDEAAKNIRSPTGWPSNLHSKAQRDQIFLKSAKKLSACCENPSGVGYEVVDYNVIRLTH